MSKVIIIGGGAAGMAAAIGAASCGHETVIYEKNEKLGKKVYITGKGRCNVTNACDTEELFGHMVRNGKFLYSAIYGFTNFDVMDLIEENGCPLKTERGDRVFPVSDKSSDVISALTRALKKGGTEVHLNEAVKDIIVEDGVAKGVVLEKGSKKVSGDAVILATGGLSYPATGSTGDGYAFAKRLGHTVTPLSPALVPFVCAEEDLKELQGLALKNIEISIFDGKKAIRKEFGEMLFTHFGVSGPVILSSSSYIIDKLKKGPLKMEIDLKPALSEEQLDLRILRDFNEAGHKQFKNSITHLYPSGLIPVIIRRSGIDPEKKISEVTAKERAELLRVTKHFEVTITALRGFNEAIITQGGVTVKEVNPSTMESKKVPGLYFAGEILDLDAVTGGFNLQIAWSTGMLAGRSI